MRLATLLILAGLLALLAVGQEPAPAPPAEAEKPAAEKKAEPAEAPRIPQLNRREPKPLDWRDVEILTGKRGQDDRRYPARVAPYVYVSVPLEGGTLRGGAPFPLGAGSRALPFGTFGIFGRRGRSLLGLPLLTRTGRHGTVIILR